LDTLVFVLLVMAALVGLGVLIGHGLADTPEESLAWKLAGHAVLGFFTLTLNHAQIPLGYVIALLLAWRATTNKNARLAASTTTFLAWLIGSLIPMSPLVMLLLVAVAAGVVFLLRSQRDGR